MPVQNALGVLQRTCRSAAWLDNNIMIPDKRIHYHIENKLIIDHLRSNRHNIIQAYPFDSEI